MFLQLIVNAALAGTLIGFLYVLIIYFFRLQFLPFTQPVHLSIALGLGLMGFFTAWFIQI